MEWLAVVAAALGIPFLIAALTRRPGQSISERSTEIGNKLQAAGQGISAIGCGMTLTVTAPIVGFAIAGLPGLLVGLVVGGLLAAAMFRSDS